MSSMPLTLTDIAREGLDAVEFYSTTLGVPGICTRTRWGSAVRALRLKFRVGKPPLRGPVDFVAIEGAIRRSDLQLLGQRRRAEASVMSAAIAFRLSAERLLAGLSH